MKTMTAAALLEQLLKARIKYGDKLNEMVVVVATGNKMDPWYENQIEVADVKVIKGEECFYIGRDHED
jgi:hypothetical protein